MDLYMTSAETRQKWKHARKLPYMYYKTMAEKKDKENTTLHLLYIRLISVLSPYFFQVHPYLKWSFVKTIFPIFGTILGGFQTNFQVKLIYFASNWSDAKYNAKVLIARDKHIYHW